MASIRERILEKIKTTLDIGNVYRSRSQAFTKDVGMATVIFPVSEIAEPLFENRMERTMTVQIMTVVRGLIPDQIADDRLNLILKKLGTDITLGGLATNITESSTGWDFEDADNDALVITQDFQVRYRTNLIDPSLQW